MLVLSKHTRETLAVDNSLDREFATPKRQALIPDPDPNTHTWRQNARENEREIREDKMGQNGTNDAAETVCHKTRKLPKT